MAYNDANKQYPKRLPAKKTYDDKIWESGRKKPPEPREREESWCCDNCNRVFKSKCGLTQHQKKCIKRKEGESFLKYEKKRETHDRSEKTLPSSQPLITEEQNDTTAEIDFKNEGKVTTKSTWAEVVRTPKRMKEVQKSDKTTAVSSPQVKHCTEPHQQDKLQQQHCQEQQKSNPQKQQQQQQQKKIKEPQQKQPPNQQQRKEIKEPQQKQLPNQQQPQQKKQQEQQQQQQQQQNKQPTKLPGVCPIDDAYEEIVKWRRNLFSLPKGNNGKKFVEEMTSSINNWCTKNDEKSLKLLMIMPSLLLQRTTKKGKARENKENLRRRLELWEGGKLVELVEEGKVIQDRLTKGKSSQPKGDDLVKQFRNHMIRGNVNAALRLLDEGSNTGLLQINDDTIKQLHEKHPEGQPVNHEMLLKGPIKQIHPVIFDEINSELVQKVALRTKGAAGPSNFDANDWRSILGSRILGTSSSDLCSAIANMAKKLCIEAVENDGLSTLMACRLVPLDKNPGLRPIGIGEVLRRIIGKMVVWVLRPELQEDAGDLQLCAGQESGCEAGIHAMHEIFNDDNTHGIIQVDANNAFNTINREAFIHNIKVICPEIATYVVNCYQHPARLFVVGGIEISSLEGTTQGDPTAMYIYALGILPLINLISEPLQLHERARQSAFADDLTGGGTIDQLRKWWDLIIEFGELIGYTAKPSKSWLIVKEEYTQYAEEKFAGTGIQITTEGQRHLGAVIGSETFKLKYVSDSIDEWIEELKVLSKIARVEPHLAYTAFVFGFQHKFTYIMRTIPNISEQLKRLDKAIDEYLVEHIMNGYKCSYSERTWLSLPPRLGGLGLIIPSELSDIHYNNSKNVTAVLTNRIVNQYDENADRSTIDTKGIKANIRIEKRKREEEKMNYVKGTLTPQKIRLLEAITEKGASNWLTAMPIKEHGFYLNKQEFWDSICLRYGLQLSRMPMKCVCGSSFNIEHALTCKKGGFINIRHNELRDFTAEVLNEVCNDVNVEPLLTPLSGETFTYKSANKDDQARLDVSARGVWIKGSKAYFDVRVFNPLAPTYTNQTLKAAHKTNENAKKREYGERILNVEHGTFTPLFFSCLGGMSVECLNFYNRLSDKLSEKRHVDQSLTRTWIRTKLSFSLLKTTNLCIRGSRSMKKTTQEELASTNIPMAVIDSRLESNA